MPLAAAGEHAHHMPATSSLWIASLAVLVHSLAMLLTTGIVAMIVYQWAGLDFLRRGWINLDAIWTAALIGMGLWLVAELTRCAFSTNGRSGLLSRHDFVELGVRIACSGLYEGNQARSRNPCVLASSLQSPAIRADTFSRTPHVTRSHPSSFGSLSSSTRGARSRICPSHSFYEALAPG